MTRNGVNDSLLTECEPHFLDAVHTIAQFSQKAQELVRAAVKRQWEPLVASLGFDKDAVRVSDWASPDKLQRAAPTNDIYLGVKLKVSDQFEAGFYRYWTVENREVGIGTFIWIKGRQQLSLLCDRIDDVPDWPPGQPEVSWSYDINPLGSFCVYKDLTGSDLADLDPSLDDLIAYIILIMTKIKGAKRFVDCTDFDGSVLAPPSDQ